MARQIYHSVVRSKFLAHSLALVLLSIFWPAPSGATVILTKEEHTLAVFETKFLCDPGVGGCLQRPIANQTFSFALTAAEIALIMSTPGDGTLSVYASRDLGDTLGADEFVTVSYGGAEIGRLFENTVSNCPDPGGGDTPETATCGPNIHTDYIAGGDVLVDAIPILGASDIAGNLLADKDNDRSLMVDQATILAGIAGNTMTFTYSFSAAIFQAKIFGSRFEYAQAPEPTSILLLGFGLAGLGFARRRLH